MNFTNASHAETNNTDTSQVTSQLVNDLLYLADKFEQFRIAFELHWKRRGAVPGNHTTDASPLAASTDTERTTPWLQ